MKKKILFIMTNLCGGGAEKVLVDIINHMDFEKFDITLFLLRKEGVYLDKLDSRINVIYDAKNMRGIYAKYIQKRFIKYFPKVFYKHNIINNYDIEIAFLEGLPTKVLAYSSNKNSKKIAWVHIDLVKKHWTKKIYNNNNEEEYCYNKMDDIVFVSNESKGAFKKIFKNNMTNKHIIYNPVIDHEIKDKANEYDVKFDKFTIVSVGRLDYQKGYDRLIQVHAELVKNYDYKLVIIGEGPQRRELEELINKLGVQNSVELKGFINNPYPYMRSADLFISSSRTEGYPLVLLEALVLKKVIIATKITGNNEVLDYGNKGIMCENSTKGIYSALRNILENKELFIELENKLSKNVTDYKARIKEIEQILL